MKISRIDSVKGRYVVATDSPDNGRSTYPECWGARSEFAARAIFGTDDLAKAASVAANYGEDFGFVFDRETGRPVGVKRLARATDE